MTNEIEETGRDESSWCGKIFEYVKNRNRIGPGKIELTDCDFFIVGPRRTLRVLVPKPRGNVYYETTRNERPETIDENFVSRWASRPHPSGNCRCSFRQSKNRSSSSSSSTERTTVEEINRVRASLCEAKRADELEQGIADLVTTTSPSSSPIEAKKSRSEITDIPDLPTIGKENNDDERAAKNKIVKDLERYIERLLQEVLSDTMKFFNDAGDTLRKSHEVLKKVGKCPCDSVVRLDPERLKNVEKIVSVDNDNPLDISFAFHESKISRDEMTNIEDRGYVNRGFSGSTNDPDSIDFHTTDGNNEHDNLDCTDSGINSVETMEFQTEPSLEQSLMEIIDAKFGKPSRCWKILEDNNTEDDRLATDFSVIVDKNTSGNNDESTDFSIPRDEEITNKTINFSIKNNDEVENGEVESKQSERSPREISENRVITTAENSLELEETMEQQNFDKLKLELLETTSSTKKISAIEALRKKLTWKFGTGCKNRDDDDDDDDDERGRENSEKTRKEVTKNKNDEIPSSPVVELRIKSDKVWDEIRDSSYEGISEDIVKFRKYRKPTIVFLHGFGSSAEIFENQLEYFSNLGYPCVAPELLGHGMSSAPNRSRDYRFEKLLKDLEIVLRHYAFQTGRKCVLVAHNYGCSFATALACKFDSNIHQLVLISGGGPTALAPPSTESAGHCCLRAVLTPLLMCGLHRDILYSARGRQHPYCGNEPIEQWPSHMRYVLDGMIWPEGDYVFHRRISTPTLLIHGLRDDKVSLVQECQMERTMIKAFLDAIPTAGHTPMIDSPEQVNHMIHCFVDLWKRKKR